MKTRDSSLFNKLFTYLIYISIVFVVITLTREDFIVIPEVINYHYLIPSFALLFLGFIFEALSAKVILKRFDYHIQAKDALTAEGLYVLSRYVPGKIWIVLGPTSYIKKKYGYPLDNLITVSLTSQFISIWTVLTISMLAIMIIELSLLIKLSSIIIWIGLSLVIFTRYFHDLAQWLFLKTIKKELNLPNISFKRVISSCYIYILFWSCYAMGFYFLCLSFNVQPNELIFFAFPLATIIGIIMIFVPGGLGAREGVLVVLLVSSNVPLQIATTISISSRLWFFFGEVFLFLVGLTSKYLSSRSNLDSTDQIVI